MLHRVTVRLYDDNILDAELLDVLATCDSRRKQELIRTFLRVGFNQIMSGQVSTGNLDLNEAKSFVSQERESPRVRIEKVPVNKKVEPKKATIKESEEQVIENNEAQKEETVVEKKEETKKASEPEVLMDMDPTLMEEEDDDDVFNPLNQLAKRFS